jgi:glycosyltransferase involved in cell wall biosynthesis
LSASKHIEVAAYTAGWKDPAARVRVRQFTAPLADLCIRVREYPLPYENTQPHNRFLFPAWAAATLVSRFATLAAGWSADISWISRSLLPTYLSVERLVKKPAVLDVDDAIWLNRGGHRVEGLARACKAVVCGNVFLADKFRTWNPNVFVIPTAIDTNFYRAANASGDSSEGLVIGWTGTSVNFPYLYSVEKALKVVLERHAEAKVLIVADKAPTFRTLPIERVEFVRWTPAAEQDAMARMSIGLMPLEDSLWARGKCSFKMLCYMASYMPVVVSPVGMNCEVLSQGKVGYSAVSDDDWVDALDALLESRTSRIEMGRNGRDVVESMYSVDRLAERHAMVFRSVM